MKMYTKGELASLYLPDISAESARNKLRNIIKKDKVFEAELLEVGYTSASKLLTPRQVEVIFNHLGEP